MKNQISELYNETRKVDKSESAKVLATAYYKILRKILSEKKEEEKIDFVRKLNKEIGNEILFEDDKNFLDLLALHEDKDILKKLIDDRPKTSISSSTLFTGYTGPTLESELRREIRTADRIDFIVSFIKYSGLVLIYDDLVEFTKNKKLRIITTSYMGGVSIIKTFETYWNDDEKDYVFFDLRPFSHQKEILEDLRLEREEYGSNKNLVVAATGGTCHNSDGCIECFRIKGFRNFKQIYFAHYLE